MQHPTLVQDCQAVASSGWRGEVRLPSSETGPRRVAPSAIHALLYVAFASTTFSKRLLSQALWGGQGRAATCHTRHHGATRGASCRAHGVPQNLEGRGSHQREPAKPLSSRHSPKVLDLKRSPANWGGPGWKEWLSTVLAGGLRGAREDIP